MAGERHDMVLARAVACRAAGCCDGHPYAEGPVDYCDDSPLIAPW